MPAPLTPFRVQTQGHTVSKDHDTKRKVSSAAQAEREAEITRRARLTASLREQRLKRDSEIAATITPAQPKKRKAKLESS